MRLVSAFLPIWLLAAVGYGARRRGLLGDEAVSVLGRFVFHLAMPAALFLTMSSTPLPRLSVLPLVAFTVSTAVVVGFGWLAVSRLFRRPAAERPIWGMTAGYVNSANLGIPVAQQVLGSVSFLAEVVLVQNLLVTPVILIALDRAGDPQRRIRMRRIASLPLRNPVILGSAAGLVWSVWRLPVPQTAHTTLALLGAAAVPTGLVALGASLYAAPAPAPAPVPAPALSGQPRPLPDAARAAHGELAAVAALKLVGQPLLALVTGLALQLTHAQLLTVVVCAGLPTAQNAFVFAQEYDVGQTLANRGVAVTTALSLATLAAAAALLGA
ncbi:AEC family transporter [Streptacidiphilus anmyonensis]|uniref:AEC family transporter n=1 Tax=Streptacidiphilus anmyonensis TaxID=405782 RepID=UPI0005AAAD7D|nr:AEC family transporter [Streptacidiphilus anmyonensis]